MTDMKDSRGDNIVICRMYDRYLGIFTAYIGTAYKYQDGWWKGKDTRGNYLDNNSLESLCSDLYNYNYNHIYSLCEDVRKAIRDNTRN